MALPEGSAALAQASSQARAAGVEQAMDLFCGTVRQAAGEGKCREKISLYMYSSLVFGGLIGNLEERSEFNSRIV